MYLPAVVLGIIWSVTFVTAHAEKITDIDAAQSAAAATQKPILLELYVDD